jgi:hypothetical protein
MKILGTMCTLALFLFLIAPTPGYSQDENKPQQQDEQKAKDNEKAKPNDRAKQDEKAKPEEKTARPEEGKRNETPNAGRQEDRQAPEANRQKEQQNQQRNDSRDQQRAGQQRPMENNQHAVQDNGRYQNHNDGDRGRRIPDDQFRTHFGREHHFHVQRDRIVNVSQPVVVYGGYSWQLEQPWPSDWSYDDDCYIDEVDGQYFLFDVLHPGIRIAVFLAE